jgi:hypothetical protein
MKITVNRRRTYDRNGKMSVFGVFMVDYLSFRISPSHYAGNKSHTFPTIRWDVINLEVFMKPPPTEINEQWQAAKALLQLCDARGVSFRASRGSLSTALLKASPFWDNKERTPAPRFVNNIARDHLPGNHYSVSDVEIPFGGMEHCYYIDQTSAHHKIASQIAIPHPCHIRARGYFRQALENNHFKAWLKTLPKYHNGLFLCGIELSTIPTKKKYLYPKEIALLKPGFHHIWLWSPEIRLLEGDHLVQLRYVVCGLSTDKHDMAITEYAHFAMEQLESPENKPYIKTLLLAAYGMLAFNPTGYKSYRYWGGNDQSRGQVVEIPEAGLVREVCVTLPDFVQIKTTNVCARGMIEAETRTRSLLYARELVKQGYHVAQIYADGLVVETDHLPFIPEGWRITHSLTNVMIPRPNAIISDQMTKLPGITREEAERRLEARVPFTIGKEQESHFCSA